MIYPYEEAQKLKKRMECKSCEDKSRLDVRFLKGSFDLWCPLCGNNTEFREQKSLTQMWRENPDSVPLTVANKLEKKYGGSRMSDTALVKADEKALMERIQVCQWAKDMNAVEKRALAQLAIEYQLDPLMGELVWYQGKPLIGLDGHIRIAGREITFEGIDARPMTEDERMGYGLEKEPYTWICFVYKRGMRAPATGVGTANPEKPHRSKPDGNGKWQGGNPVERERPWSMARARAINSALRLYFPHKIPGAVDAVEAGVMVENDRIIDGTFREVKEQRTEPPADLFGPEEEEWPQDGTLSGDPPPSGPVEDLPFRSPREELEERIESLVSDLGRTMDEEFYNYFKTVEGMDYKKATDDKLNHFANHVADLLIAKTDKDKQKKKPPKGK
ncbi:MAG: hypothetical protein C4534_06565 [Gaiellales bacterium]|nr:MAG: hypothetical protein C4534_06565 [Gaiellales bacterium]